MIRLAVCLGLLLASLAVSVERRPLAPLLICADLFDSLAHQLESYKPQKVDFLSPLEERILLSESGKGTYRFGQGFFGNLAARMFSRRINLGDPIPVFPLVSELQLKQALEKLAPFGGWILFIPLPEVTGFTITSEGAPVLKLGLDIDESALQHELRHVQDWDRWRGDFEAQGLIFQEASLRAFSLLTSIRGLGYTERNARHADLIATAKEFRRIQTQENGIKRIAYPVGEVHQIDLFHELPLDDLIAFGIYPQLCQIKAILHEAKSLNTFRWRTSSSRKEREELARQLENELQFVATEALILARSLQRKIVVRLQGAVSSAEAIRKQDREQFDKVKSLLQFYRETPLIEQIDSECNQIV